MVEAAPLLKSLASWGTFYFACPTQPDLNQCNRMILHLTARRVHYCLQNITHYCSIAWEGGREVE